MQNVPNVRSTKSFVDLKRVMTDEVPACSSMGFAKLVPDIFFVICRT